MGMKKEETVVIGDQLLTDVLAEIEADFIRFLLCLLHKRMAFLQNLTALLNEEF